MHYVPTHYYLKSSVYIGVNINIILCREERLTKQARKAVFFQVIFISQTWCGIGDKYLGVSISILYIWKSIYN